jgi:hypothetical protein
MEKYSGALTFENFGNTFFFFVSMLTSATLAHSQTGWVAIRGRECTTDCCPSWESKM